MKLISLSKLTTCVRSSYINSTVTITTPVLFKEQAVLEAMHNNYGVIKFNTPIKHQSSLKQFNELRRLVVPLKQIFVDHESY